MLGEVGLNEVPNWHVRPQDADLLYLWTVGEAQFSVKGLDEIRVSQRWLHSALSDTVASG